MLASLASGACAHSAQPSAQPSIASSAPTDFVRVAPAALDDRGSVVLAQGVVSADESRVSAVVPAVQGRVVRVHAMTGDHVAAQALLALLYSPEIAGVNAAVIQARIARTAAQDSVQRVEALAHEGAASQRELVEARASLAQSRAEETRARTALSAMGTAGSGATYGLRAPMAGTIIRRTLHVGAESRPDGEPAFVIADLSRVWVTASVPERLASSVQQGERAEVELPALPGRRFSGTVARVGAAIDPLSRAVPVRIVLDNPDGALKPEMSARITLYVDARPVVVVPTSALITRADGGYALFVRRAAGGFERRSVTVGAESNERAQVLEGLLPNEPVVVEGALLIDPGAQQAL